MEKSEFLLLKVYLFTLNESQLRYTVLHYYTNEQVVVLGVPKLRHFRVCVHFSSPVQIYSGYMGTVTLTAHLLCLRCMGLPFLQRGTTLMTSCLLLLKMKLFQMGLLLKERICS